MRFLGPVALAGAVLSGVLAAVDHRYSAVIFNVSIVVMLAVWLSSAGRGDFFAITQNAEMDERRRAIRDRADSQAFGVCMLGVFGAAVLLQFLDDPGPGLTAAGILLAMVVSQYVSTALHARRM